MRRQSIEDVRERAHGIEGWLHDEEGELLYRLARECKGRGAIVEIGSWKGKSTVWLASGSKAGANCPVIAVDPHIGSPEHQAGGKVWTFDQFRKNVRDAGVDDVVEPIVKPSVEAARSFDRPVELLFIDGAHDFASVKADLDAWLPKVVDGGVVVFHDTAFHRGGDNGPRQVVAKYVYRSRMFKDVRHLKSATWGIKARAGPIDRGANLARLAVRNVGDALYALRHPKKS
jgi:predicted O-methyltransferase YrrM